MNKKRLSQKVSAVALNVFYRKQVAPLITLLRKELPPQGEAYERGINTNFKRLCSNNPLRNGRSPPPKGKAISKAIVLISNGFATIRYETGEARLQGEGCIKVKKLKLTSIVCLRRHFPQRGKQGSGSSLFV